MLKSPPAWKKVHYRWWWQWLLSAMYQLHKHDYHSHPHHQDEPSHDKTLQTKAGELARKAQGPGFLNRLHHQTSSHHHHHHHHWYHCLVLAVFFFWNFISCDFLWEWIDSFQLERLITLPLRFSFRPAMTSDVIGENHSHLLHGHVIIVIVIIMIMIINKLYQVVSWSDLVRDACRLSSLCFRDATGPHHH